MFRRVLGVFISVVIIARYAPALAILVALTCTGTTHAQLPPVPVPSGNPITTEKVNLGKSLFWDEQLSSTRTVACGTCHINGAGGADPRSVLGLPSSTNPGPDGVPGTEDDITGSPGVPFNLSNGTYERDAQFGLLAQVGTRNTPVTINAAYAELLFMDGRAPDMLTDPITGTIVLTENAALESQALAPPVGGREMAHHNRDWDQVVARIGASRPLALATDVPTALADWIDDRDYAALFAEAFGTPDITAVRVAMAIATYERTLIADQTPFDAFLAGDTNALTPLEEEGRLAFNSLLCNECHAGATMSDGGFHYIGVRPHADDPGRFDVTGDADDMGSFRTPSLRNAELTFPYMRNGGFDTIEEVIEFYDRGGDFDEENLNQLIIPLAMEQSMKDALAAFLKRPLTDPRVEAELPPFDRPTLYTESDRVPTTFGSGAAGSGGFTPQAIAIEPALAGNPCMTFAVFDALGGASAVLVIDDQDPGNGPTIPDDALLVHASVTLQGSGDGDGYGSIPVSIPGSEELIGTTLFGRWFIQDPGAIGGVAASPGFEFTIFGEPVEGNGDIDHGDDCDGVDTGPFLFEDDFESDMGWTIGLPGDDASTGVWERVDPNGTSYQPEDDHSPDGTSCFITGQGTPGGSNGQADVDGGPTSLMSPRLLLGEGGVISYWRWFSVNLVDTLFVDVSNDDGATWISVETIEGPGDPQSQGGWYYHEFNVADYVIPTNDVRVRFVASDDNGGSLVEAGLDDFRAISSDCIDFAPQLPRMETGTLLVGDMTMQVNLANEYQNPVVVCTANFANNTAPVVTRVSNVVTDSFRVRLVNPAGAPVESEIVSYIVMEAGRWSLNGRPVEAQRYLSTDTANSTNWDWEGQTYLNEYESPVVLGQVMTTNDDWSVFWCRGAARALPPSADVFRTGKTVCEDPDTVRLDEEIGFIVFEAGNGNVGSVRFEAKVGADIVKGVDDAAPYEYDFDVPFATAPRITLLTMAGVDSNNGGWAQTHGDGTSGSTLHLSIDEDQLLDPERRHRNEHVAYVVFEDPVHIGILVDNDETIINTGFPDNTSGFVYSDDLFGTNNPLFADGFYATTGGSTGGHLRVALGPGRTEGACSGGWSQVFTIDNPGQISVSIDYRLIMAGTYESDEFTQILLEIDGVRHGGDLDDSLVSMAGNGQGGPDEDTGWQTATFNLPLDVGQHVLRVGGYNNDSSWTDEWSEVRIDCLRMVQTAAPVAPDPDITGDGHVDIDDLLLVLVAWGVAAPGDPADLDFDGEVGINDLLILIAAWTG